MQYQGLRIIKIKCMTLKEGEIRIMHTVNAIRHHLCFPDNLLHAFSDHSWRFNKSATTEGNKTSFGYYLYFSKARKIT